MKLHLEELLLKKKKVWGGEYLNKGSTELLKILWCISFFPCSLDVSMEDKFQHELEMFFPSIIFLTQRVKLRIITSTSKVELTE